MRKILLPQELYSWIKDLPTEQLGKLFIAIYKYNLWIEFDIDKDIEIIFWFFKWYFDNDIEKYKTYCDIKKENGKMWWRPKKDYKNSENLQKPKEPKKATDSNSNSNNNIVYFNNENVKGEEEVPGLKFEASEIDEWS